VGTTIRDKKTDRQTDKNEEYSRVLFLFEAPICQLCIFVHSYLVTFWIQKCLKFKDTLKILDGEKIVTTDRHEHR